MGTSIDQTGQTRSLSLAASAAPADSCGILLDLALEATAATGAAFLVPADETLRVLHARGTNTPGVGEVVSLDGTVAGEAWYRSRLVISTEQPPRGRQAALWQEERTIDVMAVPVTVESRSVAILILYHRHLGHFRRGDANTITRLAALAGELWGGPRSAAPVLDGTAVIELRAAHRVALLGAGQLDAVDTWREIVRTAATLLDVGSARISLLAGNELICQAATGKFAADVGRRRPSDFGFEGVALESMEGVLATEWSADHGAGPSSWIRSLVSVPLRRVDQVVGVLTVAESEPDRFTDQHREILVRFAVHAAAAVVELQHATATEQHVGVNRIASQVAATLATSADTPALRRGIVSEARRVLRADAARLSEVVQRHVAVTAVDGDLPIILQPPQPGTTLLCGHTLDEQQPSHRCVLPRGEGYLLAAQLGQVTEHRGCVQVVRTLTPFGADEEALLGRLTEITELVLLSRMANVRVSQYADRIRSVAEVSATLHQSLRPADAMAQAAEMLRRALGVGTVRVGHIDEVWQELIFPIDRRGTENRDGFRRPLAKGLLEEVWRTGRTFFFPQNARADVERLGLSLDTRPRCLAVAPLRTRGTISGVIAIEDESTDNAFEAEDVR
ncbi:MAG TPA: GAF domain-containing protein, partial [Gemmatimonadales bacterium]|nr:GAF domain-containing protein [Gemmatimonadales bacterium]